MPTFKEVIWAIIFISLTSAVMTLAVLQLDDSAWAEGIRADYSAETAPTEGQLEGEGMPEIAGVPFALVMVAVVIGSLLKITLLMGLPGLITIWVRRRLDRSKNRAPAEATPG